MPDQGLNHEAACLSIDYCSRKASYTPRIQHTHEKTIDVGGCNMILALDLLDLIDLERGHWTRLPLKCAGWSGQNIKICAFHHWLMHV